MERLETMIEQLEQLWKCLENFPCQENNFQHIERLLMYLERPWNDRKQWLNSWNSTENCSENRSLIGKLLENIFQHVERLEIHPINRLVIQTYVVFTLENYRNVKSLHTNWNGQNITQSWIWSFKWLFNNCISKINLNIFHT